MRIKEILSFVPKAEIKDRIVLMSPVVMDACRLGLGWPCIISGAYIFSAWPCDKLHCSTAVVPAVMFDVVMKFSSDQKTITVEKMIGCCQEASRVKVEAELPSSISMDDFLTFLHFKMKPEHLCFTMYSYMTEGRQFAVDYYGSKVVFCVKSVRKQHDSSHSLTLPDLTLSSSNATQSYDDSENPFKHLTLHSTQVSPDGDDSISSTEDCSSQTTELPVSGCSSPTDIVVGIEGECKVSSLCQDHCVFLKVTKQTRFVTCLARDEMADWSLANRKVNMDSLGGLEKEKELIRTFCLHPFSLDKKVQAKNCNVPEMSMQHVLLIFGPPGTGKSTLALAMANELGFSALKITPADVNCRDGSQILQRVFMKAIECAPSVVIMEHLDQLCPSEGGYGENSSSRLRTALLCDFLDRLTCQRQCKEKVIVIGIANRRDAVDRRLFKLGRFVFSVETGIPTEEDRYKILRILLSDLEHNVLDEELKDIADRAHSYVGADLRDVVDAARPLITAGTLDLALRKVAPSAVRELRCETPHISWSDVCGLDDVKEKLTQLVILPVKKPHMFHNMGMKPLKGCLLYGPSGCGKTTVCRALASHSGLNFISVKGSELFGKFVGESERAVRELFRKGRNAAPCIIFLDDLDSLAVERSASSVGSDVSRKVLSQLLLEMDGLRGLSGVFVLSATTMPQLIDRALLRPGRFDSAIHVPLPDASTRQKILSQIFRRIPVNVDVAENEIVDRTDGFSAADMVTLCDEAAMIVITECLTQADPTNTNRTPTVQQRHFDSVLNRLHGNTSQKSLDIYAQFRQSLRAL